MTKLAGLHVARRRADARDGVGALARLGSERQVRRRVDVGPHFTRYGALAVIRERHDVVVTDGLHAHARRHRCALANSVSQRLSRASARGAAERRRSENQRCYRDQLSMHGPSLLRLLVRRPVAVLPDPLIAVPDPLRRDPNPAGVHGRRPVRAAEPDPRAAAPAPETTTPIRVTVDATAVQMCAPDVAPAAITAVVTSAAPTVVAAAVGTPTI